MKGDVSQKVIARLVVLLALFASLCGFSLAGQAALPVAFADGPADIASASYDNEPDSAADFSLAAIADAAAADTDTDANATTADAALADASGSIEDRLSALEGVVSVIKLEPAYNYEEVYQLTFEQPISYDNLSLGTFRQEVILYYSGDANVTIVNTGGYNAGKPTAALKFSDRYNASNTNILNIEYRFFDNSSPVGLSADSIDLWEYLTCENAAMDFHRIVQSTSSVLTGKRLWTGGSKGGFTTNYQCYFQEKNGYHDADAFVAWVAPLCDGTADARFTNAIYTTIGDEMYGKQTAQAYRDLVLEYQLQCIKYRDSLQRRFYDESIASGNKFRTSYFTSDPDTAAARLWDVVVSEFAVGEWQYYLEWDRLEQVLAIEDEAQRIEAIYQLMADMVGYSDAAYNVVSFPYYVQAATEMGNYSLDLTYLRAAVAEEQKADPTFPDIALPQELEGSFCDLYLTDEQLAAFTYDSTTREALIAWAQTTTTAHIIMIDGAADTWRNVSMPSVDNPTIHRYLAAGCHLAKVSELTEADQAEFWSLLNTWLAPDPAPSPTPTQGVTTNATSTTTTAQASTTAATGDSPVPFALALCLLASVGLLLTCSVQN